MARFLVRTGVCAAWLGSGLVVAGAARAQSGGPESAGASRTDTATATAAEPGGASQELKAILSPDPTWTVQIEPSFWYVAPSGDVKLPANSGTGGFTTPGDSVAVERLNLDTPRLEPAGEVHLNSGRWRMTFSGATFSLDRHDTIADSSFRLGSVAITNGDPMDVSMEFTTVELTGGYRVWGRVFSSPDFTQKPDNAMDSMLRVYVIGGGRFYDVSFDLTRTTTVQASANADEFFGEPIVGARAELDLAKDFTVDLQLTGGGLPTGNKSSYSVDIQTGFQWRPHPNVGVQIGYRQLAFWLSDGEDASEFQYDGRLAGLFAGLVIRF